MANSSRQLRLGTTCALVDGNGCGSHRRPHTAYADRSTTPDQASPKGSSVARAGDSISAPRDRSVFKKISIAVNFHFCPNCGSPFLRTGAEARHDCCGRRFVRRSQSPAPTQSVYDQPKPLPTRGETFKGPNRFELRYGRRTRLFVCTAGSPLVFQTVTQRNLHGLTSAVAEVPTWKVALSSIVCPSGSGNPVTDTPEERVIILKPRRPPRGTASMPLGDPLLPSMLRCALLTSILFTATRQQEPLTLKMA